MFLILGAKYYVTVGKKITPSLISEQESIKDTKYINPLLAKNILSIGDLIESACSFSCELISAPPPKYQTSPPQSILQNTLLMASRFVDQCSLLVISSQISNNLSWTSDKGR